MQDPRIPFVLVGRPGAECACRIEFPLEQKPIDKFVALWLSLVCTLLILEESVAGVAEAHDQRQSGVTGYFCLPYACNVLVLLAMKGRRIGVCEIGGVISTTQTIHPTSQN